MLICSITVIVMKLSYIIIYTKSILLVLGTCTIIAHLASGPPLPPTNLHVTINSYMEHLIIDLLWEEPFSLINNSITSYTVKLNISLKTSEHLFYENITTETSLVYNASQEWINICNISVVTVKVLAQNRVGTGEAATKTIVPYTDSKLALCTSSSVFTSTPSESVILTVTVTPPLHPELKMASPAVSENRMLIYGMCGCTIFI